jgi:hypothetical protein
MWMPIGFIGLMLVISLPSMAIAWLKLRQRNLGPILDANGWAVNAKAKVNIPFGRSLTAVAALPANSQRDLADPYAESHKRRNSLIAVLVILAVIYALWHFNVLNPYLPEAFRHPAPPAVQQPPAPPTTPPAPTELGKPK